MLLQSSATACAKVLLLLPSHPIGVSRVAVRVGPRQVQLILSCDEARDIEPRGRFAAYGTDVTAGDAGGAVSIHWHLL